MEDFGADVAHDNKAPEAKEGAATPRRPISSVRAPLAKCLEDSSDNDLNWLPPVFARGGMGRDPAYYDSGSASSPDEASFHTRNTSSPDKASIHAQDPSITSKTGTAKS